MGSIVRVSVPSCILSASLQSSCTGVRLASDGKFNTVKVLVPQCLDMADKYTIRRFFRNTWRYMDAYRYVPLAIPFIKFSLALQERVGCASDGVCCEKVQVTSSCGNPCGSTGCNEGRGGAEKASHSVQLILGVFSSSYSPTV